MIVSRTLGKWVQIKCLVRYFSNENANGKQKEVHEKEEPLPKTKPDDEVNKADKKLEKPEEKVVSLVVYFVS